MSTLNGHFLLDKNDFTLDVKLSLPSTGITALFGPSGSGKTSLLRCIAGLEKTSTGYLSLGQTIWQDGRHFTPAHQRGIATVFQDSHLFPHLSIKDNLQYGSRRNKHRENSLSYDEVVQLLGIEPLLKKTTQVLSGGQRQRVAIARALLAKPQLLLMDEPLASLDTHSKSEILPYLERLQKTLSIPIIYVSHSLDEVLQLADSMLLLDKGQVQAQGDINTLLTRSDLPLAYYQEACSIISGVIAEHERDYHLTHIDIATGRVSTSQRDRAIGEAVKLKIVARDVSITLTPPKHSSINNVFSAQVHQINPSNDLSKKLVTLKVGDEYLLAQITAKSTHNLALQEKINSGETIFAQVKSVVLS